MTPRFSRPQQRITGRRARVASPNPGRCPRSRPAGPRAGASHSPGAPARPPSRRAHLRRRPPPERSSSQPCALGSAGPQNGSQRGPRDPGHSPTLPSAAAAPSGVSAAAAGSGGGAWRRARPGAELTSGLASPSGLRLPGALLGNRS